MYARAVVKARLTAGLSHPVLRRSLPEPLRARLWPADDRVYALLQFRIGFEDVVRSRDVAAALRRFPVPVEGTLVAAAGNFTIEAAQLLTGRDAILLTRSDFGWTDEGYTQIRENK